MSSEIARKRFENEYVSMADLRVENKRLLEENDKLKKVARMMQKFADYFKEHGEDSRKLYDDLMDNDEYIKGLQDKRESK